MATGARAYRRSPEWARLTAGIAAAAIAIGTGTIPAGSVRAQSDYKPGPENVVLPSDYQTRFIRYATVDKPERKIVRFLYVNPEAFAAAKKGTPAPDGTVLIMEDHAARLGPDGTPLLDLSGRFIPLPAITGLFLQEKHPGWGAGYAEEKRNGTWEYARFNPDGTRHTGSVDNCFGCHKPRGAQDFTFTFSDYVQARK